MKYDLWIDTYIPVENHLDIEAGFGGCMYETYGDEYEFIKKANKNNVWTLIDGDGMFIIPGRHYVNRFGYFITEVPWTEDDIEIDFDFDYEENE